MTRRGSSYGPEDDEDWPEFVPMAERRRRASQAMERLRKRDRPRIPGAIAITFWGRAWCENLERYRDYANRIERGRTDVRNGWVVDLQIKPREVTVSGTELYKVVIAIGDVAKRRWASICRDCASGIDSLVELLQGRFAERLMLRLCRQGDDLFPTPTEIRFSCSCPDHASMCKGDQAAACRLCLKPPSNLRTRSGPCKCVRLGSVTLMSGGHIQPKDRHAMELILRAECASPLPDVDRLQP